MSLKTPPTETVAIGTLDDNKPSFVKGLLKAQAFQILLILIVIVLIFSALAPDSFAQWSNFRLIIQNASILAVLGVGMTYIIITSGIDLSIGSVLVFSGVVSALTMRALGGEGWGVATIGILVSIFSGVCWGLLNGFLIAKAKIPPLIVTLGSLGMALGLAQILTGGVDIRDVPTVLTVSIGYGNVFGSLPIISVIALVVVVIGAIVLHFTKFGLYTYAVGSSELAARRVGVKVDRHLISVYTLSGALAGLAGILALSQFSTTAIAGQSQTNLNVIAAVVIGGTSLFGGVGTIFGTVVGLFIPAVLQNGFVITGVQPFWQQVAVGAVLITAVYVDQVRRTAATRGNTQSLWRKFVSGGRRG
ncbi:ABC transporter permease [Microbacterium enclense]|uniref:Ribose transport system permease protein n=1 Tax=Microbacterium enclense TaxID=993073 RepID=A0A1G6RT13_9MICO|nr:ABC transporter permease [Microbacterium enclense]KSU51320.1 sugar ABC transporter permease [Microbacterium enclense]SDD07095.1 ribose transport system permease protein [Microbacterium enclense]